eukprot:TRINITY_DN598_c0_g1_i3.p1 TRINITY_DN598_c0_g1~~TRINITY_DN598_c0_g1_i3.p1  ORF type:complete len:469 (-),score=50.81 TRINITY_DN598_c0_g1_i3:164-1570(-)
MRPADFAGNAYDGSTGDVTSDGYHRYKEDVKFVSEIGFNAFRLSISWTRLIPDGRGAINPKGLQFYNNFIDEVLTHGMQPVVTLNHFDLPQTLEDEYGGWIDSRIVDDFVAFSEVCFREFGDRVKYWDTVNEPNAFAALGYSEGLFAPKRCSLPSMNCTRGNSSTEPYLAAHNMLLGHAAVVKLYRNKFQKEQGGFIGIPVLSFFYWPLTNKTQDIEATQRVLDFHIGWIIEPLLYGRYPKIMQKIVGSRLPSFTKSQKKDLINSFDFIGLNHYSTLYVADAKERSSQPMDYGSDMSMIATDVNDEGLAANQNLGFGSVPLGFKDLLKYMKDHYGNPPVIIMECGDPEPANSSLPKSYFLNDTTRVSYFHDYIEVMHTAIRNGSNTKGFFVWSFLDGFEFALGYTVRFGLGYVNLNSNDLSRVPKLSMKWFQNMLLPKQELHLSDQNMVLPKQELHFLKRTSPRTAWI